MGGLVSHGLYHHHMHGSCVGPLPAPPLNKEKKIDLCSEPLTQSHKGEWIYDLVFTQCLQENKKNLCFTEDNYILGWAITLVLFFYNELFIII